MLVVKRGCSPHLWQLGEKGACGGISCCIDSPCFVARVVPLKPCVQKDAGWSPGEIRHGCEGQAALIPHLIGKQTGLMQSLFEQVFR
jgi:hypothetical protein